MSTSTLPAYIDALIAALRARPALDDPDVLVSDGLPSRSLAGVRLITVGGQAGVTVEGEQRSASLGAQRREEDYRVRVFCSAQSGGSDQKLVRDQAFALMAEVEACLRGGPEFTGDPTLGGIVRFSAVEGGIALTQSQPNPDEPIKGRWAEVAFDIHVTNRI